MMWKEELNLSLLSFSTNNIDMEIKDSEAGDKWRITGFYGAPKTARRVEAWRLLCNLSTAKDLPWLCLGDFNEIMWSNEKTGQCDRRETQMTNFRTALDNCGLNDLGFTGNWFTWERGRTVATNVRERLDRCVATSNWIDKFPNYAVAHLNFSTSDHKPILLSTDTEIGKSNNKRRKRFHFEASWLKEEGSGEVIKSAWEEAGLLTLPEKIKDAGAKLKKWFGIRAGTTRVKIDSIQKQIDEIQSHELSDYVLSKENDLKEELNALLEKEEIFWRQRSRVSWLCEEDKNTRFFHAQASQREKNNRVKGLKNEDGDWCEEEGEIKRIATDYFKNLFQSQEPENMEEILEIVNPCVTNEMNLELLSDFKADEVHKAISQMFPTKAPGPDGISALFYQKFWNVVGSDVTKFCLDFLNNKVEIC
ncbi:hypothetical protein DITRI_Ditri07aG0068900 [Diplodiscus trichospermus]